jgi:serine/threonine protein kinase
MATPATTANELLETAILSVVVTRFVNLGDSTSRRLLLIKFEGQPASEAIGNLNNHNLLHRQNSNAPTDDEVYLPSAGAFQLCGNPQFRDQARTAATIVLHTLKQMFKGDHKKEGFVLEDLERHVKDIYPNRQIESATLKLGLYLARDLRVLGSYRVNSPAETEVVWFQIGESVIGMANPDAEWDRVMVGYRLPATAQNSVGPSQQLVEVKRVVQVQDRKEPAEWERIGPLGGGGQSDVFLVRSRKRVAERANSLSAIRTALDGDKRADLAKAIWSYARPDLVSELGALKVFKIPPESGNALTPLSGSTAFEAVERFKNEVTVLGHDRPGLPRLLDHSVAERWVVTEYFPEGTLERHSGKFRGNALGALAAFRSLVQTVASLHRDGYIHRDIKPPNVFIRKDDELVLGDFGIVYLPNTADRITRTGERVGPRDYMPQWANLGVRHEKVEPCFDVYMLGKLLWAMVDGRMFLPREYQNRAEFDLTKTFPNDPDMFLVNRILGKCVVEDSGKCLSSAQELLLIVDTAVSAMNRGGQLLTSGVPRPCRVCGTGFYQPQSLHQGQSVGMIRIWTGGSDTVRIGVQTFACDSCGHIAFFKSTPR